MANKTVFEQPTVGDGGKLLSIISTFDYSSLSNDEKEELSIVIFTCALIFSYGFFVVMSMKRSMPPILFLCAMIWLFLVVTQLRLTSSYFTLDEGLKWADVQEYISLLDMSTTQHVSLVISFILLFWASKRCDDAMAAKKTKMKEAKFSTNPAMSLPKVIIRNICFLIVIELLNSTLLTLHDCPNRLISGEPVFTSIIPEFADKFPLYHPNDYLLVRLTHAFAILNDFMRITRPRARDFVIWHAIYYIIGEAIGDLAHYGDDVDLADHRSDFDSSFARIFFEK